ncbi:MAG: cation transporter [Parvibaculum sp.]|uniref:cation diffusion facilitator family transporter n=1 Tax=Parvibaculum sp. TaxID=2024848 RepID=UPI00349FF801
MRVRAPFVWPEDKAKLRRRAIVLEWATLGSMGTAVIVLYFVLGNSQAMRTAWIEDVLSLIPATAYLVASAVEQRKPTTRFPLGYYRAVSIAHLVGATAILVVGCYVLVESAAKLVEQEHPTIGLMSVFGCEVWGGWLMMAALFYSTVPPVILGRLKMPIAREIHDKPLLADAAIQKADWMTGTGAIVGIAGVGFGFWWADAVAALFISVDIVRDGVRHSMRAMGDLADRIPHTVRGDAVHPAIRVARDAAAGVDGVARADVKLREEGHLLTGIVYVELRSDAAVVDCVDRVRKAVEDSDWRLYDISVMPVRPGTI